MRAIVEILIVDDSEVVRRGLALCVERFENMQVIGEAADGYTAINMARRHEPDLVIMDVRMQGIDGIATTQKIKNILPDIRVLMLSGHDSDHEVLAAFASGADGYCLKGLEVRELEQAIWAVIDGIGWIAPSLAKTVFQYAADHHVHVTDSVERLSKSDSQLSLPELEVLAYIAKGCSNQEIAEALSISVGAVKTLVRTIIDKLQLADSTQNAVKALRSTLS